MAAPLPLVSAVSALCFAPDAKTLLIGRGSVLAAVDAASGAVLWEKCALEANRVHGIACSSEHIAVWGGAELLLGAASVHAPRLDALGTVPDWVWSARFLEGGRLVAVALGHKGVQLWDVERRAELRRVACDEVGVAYAVALHGDSWNALRAAVGTPFGDVLLWEPAKGGAVAQRLQGHTGSVFRVAFSEDGARLLSASDDRSLRLWRRSAPAAAAKDNEAFALAVTAFGHEARVWDCCFAGDALVSTAEDALCCVWSERGQLLHRLRGHIGDVWCAAATPDGACVATGGADGRVSLWRLSAHRTAHFVVDLAPLASSPRDLVRVVAPSAAASALWIAWDSGRVQRVPRGAMAATAAVKCGAVPTCIAATRLHCGEEGKGDDSEWVAVGCKNGSLHLLPAASASEPVHWRGHAASVLCVRLDAAADSAIVLVSADGHANMRVWRWAPRSEAPALVAELRVGNGVRITALALAARRGLVLSGDLHGSVNLFAFPCPSPPAPNASPAPAAAIAPAAFLPRLYGGKRVTVMEWFDASRGLLLSAGADGQATLLQAEAREGAHSALTPLRCFRLETGDAIDALGPWDARLTRLVAARLARGRLTATDLCSGTELCDADAGAAVPTGPFCVWREACGDFGLAMCEGRRLHLRAPALTERLSASPLHVGLLWHALPATALSLLALDARGGDALAVTGSEDCSLHLWRVRDGQLELLARTSHRQHTVRSLSLHEDAPRGERGAATHRRFWLFAGGRRDMLEALCVELPLSPPHLVHVRPVASVGGGAIDRAASNAGWWRAADAGERLQHMEHRVLACVSFAEDAAHVVLAGSSSGELICWELARGEGGSVLRRGASLGEAAGLRSPILCLRLLPSQPGIAWRLVCAGNSAGLVLLLVWRREGEAGAGTLRLVAKLRAHQCGANCLDAAWADDGSDDVFVASGGDDQAISVARVSCAWEAAAVDGPRAVACRTVASAHASAVRSVRWVGSRRLVSVGADQLVHAWRCEGAAIERGAASRTVVGDPAAAEPCGARGALVAGEGFELVALAE